MPGPGAFPVDPRRARHLAAALAALEARFGAGVVRRLRDAPAHDPADRAVSSGSVGLDRATGLGGFPRGHLTELLGPESSGKTTLLHAALAATQRAGGLVALVDAEDGADGASLAAAASTCSASPPSPPCATSPPGRATRAPSSTRRWRRRGC